MARTLKKTEMEDILGFTTPLALSELGFFSPLGAPGIEDSLFDDVYKELVGKELTDDVGLAPETISAGELLDELDLKGGDVGEAGWMTDKIDFTGLDTSILATETRELTELDSNLKLETFDSSLGEFILTVSQENFELSDVLVTNNPTSPASPEQKVPDFAPLSPVSSVLSPMSVATDDSGISFASLDEDVTVAELLLACGTAALPVDQPAGSFTTNDSLATTSPKVESKRSSVTGARTTQSPYSKDKTTLYTVKPKVKTPHQRMRKREQNKDAATRYRVKKRGEQDKIATECEDVEKVNRQLKDQVGSLTKEIDYLKNLMLEVYKTRLQKQQL